MDNLKQNPQQPDRQKEEDQPSVQLPDEPVFYNVMPKVKSYDGMVEPVLKLNPTQDAPTAEAKHNSWFQAYKFYIIMAVVVAIGAPVTYFVVTKVMNKPIEEENLLVKDPGLINQDDNQSADGQFNTPPKWREDYFGQCGDVSMCGDEADPDRDGMTNLQEFDKGTDPNNADSDQDGLSDGDETGVFFSNPLSANTAGNKAYTDKDYVKGAYSFSDDKSLTTEQIKELSERMKAKGLHPPTINTLGDTLLKVYGFDGSEPAAASSGTATSTPPITTTSSLSGIDMSLEAKQDRDAQRSSTIKNIGLTLLEYQKNNGTFPDTIDFTELSKVLKPYLRVAVNFVDPINQEPYVYTYTLNEKGDDYTLSFYSEVANSIIKKHAADAQKDKQSSEAAMYDDQRKTDLESLRIALLLYSNNNSAGNQEYVFPTLDRYKSSIMPNYIGSVPKDPKTVKDYEYQVSETFDTFTLKALLDNPSPGSSGYLCNQEECREY